MRVSIKGKQNFTMNFKRDGPKVIFNFFSKYDQNVVILTSLNLNL